MEQCRSKKNYAIKDERLDDIIKEADLALNINMEKIINIAISNELKENLKDIFKKLSDIYDRNSGNSKIVKKSNILYYIFYDEGNATCYFGKNEKYIKMGVCPDDIAYELYVFTRFYNKLEEYNKEINITYREFLKIYGFLDDLINNKNFNNSKIIVAKTYSAYSFFIKSKNNRNRHNIFLKTYKALQELYVILNKIKNILLQENKIS